MTRQRVLQIDTDTGVHLVGAGARVDVRGRGDGLGHVDGGGDVVRRRVGCVGAPHCVVGGPSRALGDVDEIDDVVLHSLERADGFAELHPLAAVRHAHLEDRLTAADLVGTQDRRGPKYRGARRRRVDRLCTRRRRRERGGDGLGHEAVEPIDRHGRGVDERAVAVGEDQIVGTPIVGGQHVDGAPPSTVVAEHGSGAGAQQPVGNHRHARATRGNQRQHLVAPRGHQRRDDVDREHGRREDGAGHRGAAELFEDHRHVATAGTRAAMALGYGKAQPSQLGEARPFAFGMIGDEAAGALL